MKHRIVSSVLGVDPNSGREKHSGIGYARWLKNKHGQWTLDTYGLIFPEPYSVPIERRLADMGRKFWEATAEGGPASAELVIVEKPWAVPGRVAANNALWRTLGLCEGIAALRGMPVTLVTPSTWRRSTCGNARTRTAAKIRAVDYVDKTFDIRVGVGPDIAEAMLIGLYQAQLERDEAIRRRGRSR